MRRLLTLILMIAIFAVQSVSFSHAHASRGPEDCDSHSGRPHFHTHGSHSHAAHHEHSHPESDEQEFAVTLGQVQPPEHDSDACYLPDPFASTASLISVGDLEFRHVVMSGNVPARFDHHAFVRQQHVGQFAVWPRSTARVPLYLRSLAILC